MFKRKGTLKLVVLSRRKDGTVPAYQVRELLAQAAEARSAATPEATGEEGSDEA